MTALLTIRDINDTVNHEPRIQDTVLGERLGMAQPLNIRKTIQNNTEELEAFGSIHVAREMIGTGKGARRKVDIYYLSEPQALLVCMFSRTEKAAQVRKALIDVFMEYRRAKEGRTTTVRAHTRRLPAKSREITPEQFASWVPAEDLLITASAQLRGIKADPEATRHIAIARNCIERFSDEMTQAGLMPAFRQITRLKDVKGAAQ